MNLEGEKLVVIRHKQASHAWDSGMQAFGIPFSETAQLGHLFQKGMCPPYLIDAVVSQWERLRKLHPDKFPFKSDDVFDDVFNGLAIFPIRKLWLNIDNYLRGEKGRLDISQWYSYDTPTQALASLLQDYALTKCNPSELQAQREVHF
jgi:hypothetical protein